MNVSRMEAQRITAKRELRDITDQLTVFLNGTDVDTILCIIGPTLYDEIRHVRSVLDMALPRRISVSTIEEGNANL